MNSLSLTSLWTASARALEYKRPTRLIEDPYADALTGEDGWALAERIGSLMPSGFTKEPDAYIVIRTHYLDEELRRAVQERGIRQVVLLGAGMDTRAFRLGWLAGTRLFELDRAEIFERKNKTLTACRAVAHCERRCVGADLIRPFDVSLREAGFDPGLPGAWVLEGVMHYLEEAEVRAVLRSTQSLSAPGSWIGGDLASATTLNSPTTLASRQFMAKIGAPWRFGTDEPEALFGEYGWTATVTDGPEYGRKLGRWPYPPRPPRTHALLVSAVRTS